MCDVAATVYGVPQPRQESHFSLWYQILIIKIRIVLRSWFWNSFRGIIDSFGQPTVMCLVTTIPMHRNLTSFWYDITYLLSTSSLVYQRNLVFWEFRVTLNLIIHRLEFPIYIWPKESLSRLTGFTYGTRLVKDQDSKFMWFKDLAGSGEKEIWTWRDSNARFSEIPHVLLSIRPIFSCNCLLYTACFFATWDPKEYKFYTSPPSFRTCSKDFFFFRTGWETRMT